jgi:hypothetical protein
MIRIYRSNDGRLHHVNKPFIYTIVVLCLRLPAMVFVSTTISLKRDKVMATARHNAIAASLFRQRP